MIDEAETFTCGQNYDVSELFNFSEKLHVPWKKVLFFKHILLITCMFIDPQYNLDHPFCLVLIPFLRSNFAISKY